MDILTRLRVLLWLLVLCLWGTLVYQYLGEDPEFGPQMQWISNPYRASKPLPQATPAPTRAPGIEPSQAQGPQEQAEEEPAPGEEAAVPSQIASLPAGGPGLPPPEVVPLPAPWSGDKHAAPGARLKAAPPPSHFIKPIPPRLPTAPGIRTRAPTAPSLRRHEQLPVPDSAPAAPRGFTFTQIRHFNVYSEEGPPEADFLDTLEKLHANLMLDLAAFSPWAREERVAIFLFRNQDSYRRVTGRPAWSGGASSVSKRKIYLYESEELIGILAHELCHIYFDGFFVGGKTNPLWLSEGLATLVQVERGLASPNWLPENLEVITRGGGYTFDDLMRVEDTAGANDDNVRLWYTQAYSVVRFLIRSQFKSSFYHFCRHLRDGRPAQEALYRAYGMPFNRLKALEHAWRYDVTTRRITNLSSR
ncbi:MAG: hypothetical protein HY554_03165 [Elusimicrobia bacterium]|nr:hypothetical protein [Elusimicrobiota bacterium]